MLIQRKRTMQEVLELTDKVVMWTFDDKRQLLEAESKGWATCKAWIQDCDDYFCSVTLTAAGRAYLSTPVELAPPPKTDKERIAELEASIVVAYDTLGIVRAYFEAALSVDDEAIKLVNDAIDRLQIHIKNPYRSEE